VGRKKEFFLYEKEERGIRPPPRGGGFTNTTAGRGKKRVGLPILPNFPERRKPRIYYRPGRGFITKAFSESAMKLGKRGGFIFSEEGGKEGKAVICRYIINVCLNVGRGRGGRRRTAAGGGTVQSV